jgi:hypothetical protein
MRNGKFGKDHVENFIEGSLRGGGMGPSEEIVDKKVARGQTIKTAFAMDNVELAYSTETSLKDEGGFRGSPTNLKHSIEGAEAVDPNNPGAAGPVKHVIIADH